MLLIRGLLRVISQTLFFGAILFLPIGTWDWPRALQFLFVFGLISLASHLALARWAPASLEARVKRGATRDQPRADRAVTWVLALTHLAWFVVIPNDVFRWQVFPKPSVVVSGVGGVLCLLGYAIMLAAVVQNAFATPVVGDQSHRHQALVDKGVYGRIRHPMYLGHLLFLMGLPLWLESTLGLLLVPVVFAPVVGRILVEEKTLMKNLQGYAGYKVRVPYRLLPFVW